MWESVQNCWSAKHNRLGTGPHLPRYHSPSAWGIARVLLYLFRYQPSANVLARFSFAASPVCQMCGPQVADAPFFTPPRRLSTLFFPKNVSYRYSFLTIVPFVLKTPQIFTHPKAKFAANLHYAYRHRGPHTPLAPGPYQQTPQPQLQPIRPPNYFPSKLTDLHSSLTTLDPTPSRLLTIQSLVQRKRPCSLQKAPI